MQINIKNMVCPRCIMAVEQILTKMDVPFREVQIGYVNLSRTLNDEELRILDLELQHIGFERLTERKQKLVEDIKIALLELVNQESDKAVKTSNFLSDRFNLDYAYISSTFSDLEGESIEKFLINLRIDKVKELLQYDMSLADIAYQLQYSSVAYLSNQFKKNTGLSPSEFKKSLQTSN